MTVEAVTQAIDSLTIKLDQKINQQNENIEKNGAASLKTAQEIGDLAKLFNEIRAEMADLAQKSAPTVGGALSLKTPGKQFIESDVFKSFDWKNSHANLTFGLKNTVISAPSTVFEDQRPGVIPGPFKPLTIRDRLSEISTTSNSIVGLRELTNTNLAAETAQGSPSPESSITFERMTTNISDVTTHIKISRDLEGDSPAIASYIDTRLRDNLAQRVDQQLLIGDGTGVNISGLTNAGNFVGFTPTAGANLADSIRKAKYNRWAVGAVVDTAVVNPEDWEALEGLKTTTGEYLYGLPGAAANAQLYGVSIVMSAHMPAGNFLIGAMRSGAFLYQRQASDVMLGYDGNDFTNRLITMQGVDRLGLAVDRPWSFMYGAITS